MTDVSRDVDDQDTLDTGLLVSVPSIGMIFYATAFGLQVGPFVVRMPISEDMWALLILLLCMNTLLCRCLDKEDVIFAVNAGGDAHVDSFGILYQRDFNKIGTESDYGKKLSIQRVKPHDQILYQTERYSHTTFGYDIPIMQDGDYVMVLKFSEVYFTNSGLKVLTVCCNVQCNLCNYKYRL